MAKLSTTDIYGSLTVSGNITGTLKGNADSATNATYATKIGTNANHPAIGSATKPVYVDSTGTIKEGTALGSMAYKEINDYLASATRGAKNGVASLDASGHVPSSQLPSYVDDVLEYSAKSGDNGFPDKGETGKIYVDTSTNLTYRWSGSAYVEISPSLALGETSSTAYAGDKGVTLATNLSSHTDNTKVHITSAERTSWNGKEDKSNKVASWSSTTTDDHYPSEKLVKDALDTHTHKYAGSSSAGGSATSAVALTSKNIGSTSQPVYFNANGKPAAISYTIETNVPSGAVFTDSHYTAVPVLGASDSKANATTSNDATYLNIIEDDAKSGGIQIIGSGATTVSATNGVLTISSTDNNNQVTQTVNSSANTYPILASATANASKTITTTSVFATGIKITPSTNTITATTFSGNATSATSATSATNDSSSQEITSTYIKGLSASGQTVTYTKGDGTTDTITTQDTTNTAGSTDTSSKIYLIGATSQTDNPQTYSDNQVYATSGQLDANKVRVAEKVTLQYNSSTESLDFVFA